MKVAVVHNQPVPGKRDSEDVLDEVSLVTGALQDLGLDFQTFAVYAGPSGFVRVLTDLLTHPPDVIFNLVEGIGEDQRLCPAMASCFDLAGLLYTGSPFEVLLTTTDKILTKAVLSAHGIPTPAWQRYCGKREPILLRDPLIAKPSWEDASVGIDDDSVFYCREALYGTIHEKFIRHARQPLLIEEFIDGREFNVSLLEHPEGTVEVLPLAEISFHAWPAGKPRILNYKSKWHEHSFEYNNTPRHFNSAGAAAEEITDVALRCWNSFGLRGYARVDIRLDPCHGSQVIEVNANPCIAPDSGFIAAAAQGGYLPRDIVKSIMMAALGKGI